MAITIPVGITLQSLNINVSLDSSTNITTLVYNVSVQNAKSFVRSSSGTVTLTDVQIKTLQAALTPVFDAITTDLAK